MSKPKPKAECFNCHKPATDDDYCFGCRTHICMDCTKDYAVSGFGHDPAEHLQEPE